MKRIAILGAGLPLLLALAGCPPREVPRPPPPAAVVIAPPPPEARADGRLPALASPQRYALSFDIDPAKPSFTGRARIDVSIPTATHHLVLHGRDLTVTEASVEDASGIATARVASRPANGGKVAEELVLSFPRVLQAGAATITLAWSAPFGRELSGFYRVVDDGKPYVFSQLESTDARRAFPCFDEPSFKTPFELEITVPRGQLAFANTREDGRAETRAGTTFRFARTLPLPTYLVAVAIGDLDVREGTAEASTKIRLVTTKGKTDAGQLALDTTASILGAIERTLGIPYPYDKLDIVAVPDFAAGAMENPGLVTFREERLLVDAEHASFQTRRGQALIIAHELAHQWFGDLVTAAWWNDIWLNEGLATWLQYRVVDAVKPAYGAKLDAAAAALAVMDTDALSSARAVRQPVATANEVHEAFDGITYDKGAAVFSTIGSFIGDEALRKGVHAYLETNAHRSVTTPALLEALDRASRKDVTQMASQFLDHTGVPEVTTELACDRGGWHIEVGEEPFRPIGVKAPENDTASWSFPVCVAAAGRRQPACADLSAGAPSLVAGAGPCPAWIHPNAASSYFRFALGEAELVRLARASATLEPALRMSLVSNAWASVRSGKTPAPVLLRVLPELDADPSRHVIDQVTRVLAQMSDALVSDEARPRFRAFVEKRLGKRKRALGWELPRGKGDEADLALARLPVLAAMGDLAEDDATLREAEAIAVRWLTDPATVDADVAAVAVDLASRRAGLARLDALRKVAKESKTRERRLVALGAMMGFEDPAVLEAALGLLLTGEIRAPELRYVMGPALARRTSRAQMQRFVREHWTELRTAIPGGLAKPLVDVARTACSDEEVEAMRAFYKPRAAEIEGASRRLAEALETSRLCAALRANDKGALSAALVRGKQW